MRALPIVAVALLVACAGAPQMVGTDRVRIFDAPGKPEKDWGYDPPAIQVARGTTVTFTNTGAVFHTVTADGPTRAFDLGVDRGRSGTLTFDRAGDWPYHCGVHPDMKGLVRVCDGPCR